MANGVRMPVSAIVEKTEGTLLEVVTHATSDARICVFALPDGSRRYVTENEWLAGVDRLRAQMREQGVVTSKSPSADKIALFRSLFRGREGAYARGYLDKRRGTIGYSPACANERTSRCQRWNKSKRGSRCGECPHRVFVPRARLVSH